TPLPDGDRVTGVAVESKGGRDRLLAPVTIDATGDADIAARAGVPCEVGTNILSLWALAATLDAARQAIDAGDGTALLTLFAFGGDAVDPHVESAERTWTLERAADVTAFALAARAVLREHYQAAQAQVGRRNSFPLTLPTMAQYRMTRRIHGRATLRAGQAGRRHADAVGLAADWRAAGSVWEIPYGALLPTGARGLLAAGRCISATGDAWHVTRVIPAAALTGQVAGVAARLAVARRGLPDALEAAAVQEELRRMGIPCGLADVYSAPPR
ncbi:MAG TPA: FAD-dependent oxidoreductase, partial [Armatimonadota bacterium]|nr:FAD-dependent oxidoreductase [Armatimonadota bacterium]